MNTRELRFGLPVLSTAAPRPGENFVGNYYLEVSAGNVGHRAVPKARQEGAVIEPGDLLTVATMTGHELAGATQRTGDKRQRFIWQKERTVAEVVLRPQVDDWMRLPRTFSKIEIEEWHVEPRVEFSGTLLDLDVNFRTYVGLLSLRTALEPFDPTMRFQTSPTAPDPTRAIIGTLLAPLVRNAQRGEIEYGVKVDAVRAQLDNKIAKTIEVSPGFGAPICYTAKDQTYEPPTRRLKILHLLPRLENMK